jgi:hypothetical protein
MNLSQQETDEEIAALRSAMALLEEHQLRTASVPLTMNEVARLVYEVGGTYEIDLRDRYYGAVIRVGPSAVNAQVVRASASTPESALTIALGRLLTFRHRNGVSPSAT